MKEFKIGGKITLEDNVSYRIIEIIELEGKEYLLCCTTEKPIIPKVLEKKKVEDEIYVKLEEDPMILKKIISKSLQIK